MNVVLVGAGAAIAALVVIILLIVLLLGCRSSWVLVALGISLGCATACGAIVWRAFSELARM